MNDSSRIARRSACAAMLGAGGTLLLGGQLSAAEKPVAKGKLPTFKNADFYDAAGKFNAEAAKDAYLALMRAFGYPIGKKLRETLAATDFGLGRFTEVGLGLNIWVSDKKYNYTTLEIYLLPNQMIPEHWHVALEAEGVPSKMESWLVRYGTSYTYGEGPAAAKMGVKIHESEKKFITTMNETVLHVGDVTGIKRPGEKHWQQAGTEGAIVTEVSTYHAGEAVRFTNPNIKF
jgi:hypothetical protein